LSYVILNILSVLVFTGFDLAAPGMQFVEDRAWIPAYDIRYHLGADGISAALQRARAAAGGRAG
jgi:NADH:ubiquinone oxidoreductase subunit 4 (subunit M)